MRLLLVASAFVLSFAAHAQDGAYWFSYPYDGSNAPLDLSRVATGSTVAEACAKRSPPELIGDFSGGPIIYVGILHDGSCGFQWLNLVNGPPGAVIDRPLINPAWDSCANYAGYPATFVRPSSCSLTCPADQKNVDGVCQLSSGPNLGKQCPSCGNPVNPANGNKFQEEVDYAAPGSGQLVFVRYYNDGREAVNGVLGGFWSHSYNAKILASSSTTITYYHNNGRQSVFNLVSGNWAPTSDIADTLTELIDANQRRSGWRYRIAATEDTEVFNASGSLTALERRDGLTLTLTYSDGTNGSSSGNGGFVLNADGTPTTSVLPKGMLLRATDQFGRSLTFGTGNKFRLTKLTDPAGGSYLYAYDAAGNLSAVTYPDDSQRLYVYNESANTSGSSKPNALTGITDENGARFATFKYDSYGRAIESKHLAGGVDVERYQFSYTASGAQTAVTDPLGTVRNYGFQSVNLALKSNSVDQPTGSEPASAAYDANGNVTARTDWNGNRSNFTYDLTRNLETSRTEGLTASGGATSQTRTIATQWHTSFRLPTKVAEPLRITTYVYNGDGGPTCGLKADNVTPVPGVLCSKSVQTTTDTDGSQGFAATTSGSSRAVAYTYNKFGQVLTVNGARTDLSDITTFTYYSETAACPTTNGGDAAGCRGQLQSVANALTQTTQYVAYNAHGQPLAITDSNGLTTTLAYDARKRLASRTVGSEVTTYQYDAIGQLMQVTLPDGSYLTYGYDGAHRLTGMQDNLGNQVAYTLDAMGNRTQEQVRDPANTLAQTRSRVYNSLNRLSQEIGAAARTTQYAYDTQGNVTSVTDALNHVTSNEYDALNRLKKVTDPNLGVTQYAYNGVDALTQVTDPRTLVTGYAVDGLGNLTSQASPDTGTTSSTYDAAGNLLTQTDAKSQVTTYSYDALNRVTLVAFHDGSKQTYAYDQGTNGVGRLSSITETDAANAQTSLIQYAYDANGRVTSETRTVAGVAYAVGYSYDSSGRLSGMTYPSGRTLAYSFDALGRVNQVSTAKDAQTQVVVQNVQYQPFGGVKSFTLGNGQIYSRTIDQDGRIASYTLGASSFALTFDAASRITGIGTSTYGYDNLDRLTSATLSASNYGYSYDAVGNRLSKTTGANSDSYAYSSTSNQLSTLTPAGGTQRSFVFDANGSTTNDGVNTYSYDTRGRMKQATSGAGATSYQLNALGQRVKKSTSTSDTVFEYDTRGRLIAETDAAGALKRELIYLGDIPVAVYQ